MCNKSYTYLSLNNKRGNMDKRKHIAVTAETHKEFKLVAKLKGMTHEGLIKYFIKEVTK